MAAEIQTGGAATPARGNPMPATSLLQAMQVAFDADQALEWNVDDDGCDCTFQRVGWWANPYLGITQEVRLCCAWAFLFEQFPAMQAFMRVTEGWRDPNTGSVRTDAAAWDGEVDMPRAIWHRQRARIEGLSLAEVRVKYADQSPPRAVRR